jgi:hypothetical protein
MIRTGRRRGSEPELVGASEAADLCGCAQSNLRTLRGLPEPYAKLRATTLWRKTDMRRFAEELEERRAATGTSA